MLVFVTTDACVAHGDLQRLADEQLKERFNELTVDGCTSTNDTVLLFASGAAPDVPAVTPGTPAWEQLSARSPTWAMSLASQLIADGEGVTHVMLVDIDGRRLEHDARVVAKAVAESPLVKTAAFGGDPNPGRILQAVGSSGVDVDAAAIDIAIGGVRAGGGRHDPRRLLRRRRAASAARTR